VPEPLSSLAAAPPAFLATGDDAGRCYRETAIRSPDGWHQLGPSSFVAAIEGSVTSASWLQLRARCAAELPSRTKWRVSCATSPEALMRAWRML